MWEWDDDDNWAMISYPNDTWDSPEAPPSNQLFYLIDNVREVAEFVQCAWTTALVARVVDVAVEPEGLVFLTVRVEVDRDGS